MGKYSNFSFNQLRMFLEDTLTKQQRLEIERELAKKSDQRMKLKSKSGFPGL